MNTTNDNQPTNGYSWDPTTGQPTPNPGINNFNQSTQGQPIPNANYSQPAPGQPIPPNYGNVNQNQFGAPTQGYDNTSTNNQYGMPNQGQDSFTQNNQYGVPNQSQDSFTQNNQYGVPNQSQDSFTQNNQYGMPTQGQNTYAQDSQYNMPNQGGYNTANAQPGLNPSFNFQYSENVNQIPNQKKSAALSLWCMILGIIALITSCFILGGVLGIISVILGIISFAKKESRPGRVIAGFITSLIAIFVSICVLFALNSDEFKEEFMKGYNSQFDAVVNPETEDDSDDTDTSVVAESPSVEESHAIEDDSDITVEEEQTEVDPVVQALFDNADVAYTETDDHYILFVVDNNNDDEISCDIEVTYYDKDGNVIGTETDSVYNVMAHGRGALVTAPPTDDKYNEIEYDTCSIDYWIGEADTDYKNYGNDLSFETTPEDYELKFTVSNDSGAPKINGLYCICIFYKNDDAIDFSTSYISDLEDTAEDYFFAPDDYDDYEIVVNSTDVY